MNKRSVRVELVSRFYSKNHFAFFTAVLVAILNGTTGLAVSWIIKELIDMISGQSRFSLEQLIFICIGFIAYGLILAVIGYHSEPRFIRKAMMQYKNKAFSLLTAKSIASFTDEATSTYLSALTNDATAIETNYISQIPPIVTNTVTFAGALALMLYNSPLLTGFVLLIMLLPTLVSGVMGNKMKKVQEEVSNRNGDFTATISDLLGGFQVIKSFRAEDEGQKLFAEQNGKLEDAKCRMRKTACVAGALGGLSGLIAQLGVFLAGSYLALKGQGMTVGSVMMFVNLMNFLIGPVSVLPKLLGGFKAAGGLIDKLSGSLEEKGVTKGSEEIETVGEAISLRDVSFSYDGTKDVLHDINYDFLPGKSYAIVGASGSGKSTFLNLLTGANNYKGEIRMDGKELRTITSDSLFDLMTFIRQNVFIFNSSIRDNVTMFRDFPDAKVEDALKRAHLTELIDERGASSTCGENGRELSGGEKQRISIARSLLKDSSILLADEATSALDAKTSHEVINEILELNDMTRIVVTHSLDRSLLSRYDEILVIKDGTIEEAGDFDSLIRNDGYFKALYKVAG